MLEKIDMPEEIKSEFITLVKRTVEHSVALFVAVDKNRDNLSEFLSWPPNIVEINDIKKYSRIKEQKWEDKDGFAYLIIENSTNEIIGSIDAFKIDYEHHMAEIGYWLDFEARGSGYMTKAVKLIETHLFLNRIHRIEIRCDATNVKSYKVAERAGYDYEGTLKDAIFRNGIFYDVRLYAKVE
jgi:ribosomal-protein-serine acetyltransferase